MAVTIPIISEFDGKGIQKAVAEFKNLEGAGAKAKFALQKAALPAAAAIGGLAVVIGDATKAAMEDAKAQELLAQAIEKNTLAGQANVKAAEAYIEKTMMAAAVADDQLRPALATLVQTTGDLTYSQELLNTALDISAATGTDLGAVTDAVAKAYAGNTKALGNLIPSVRELAKGGASLDEIMQAVNATVGGAATVAANSAEGQFKRLSLTIGETKEAIGAAFLPILEQMLPKLQQAAQFIQDNADVIVKLMFVVGGLSGSILALNAAMKIYAATLTLVKVATLALETANNGLDFSYASLGNRLALFSTVVASLAITFDGLSRDGGRVFKDLAGRVAEFTNLGIAGFEMLANSAVAAVNYINSAFNALLPGDPFSKLDPVKFGRLSTTPFGAPGSTGTTGIPGPTSGPDFVERRFAPPSIPTIPAVVVPPVVGGGGGGGGGRVGGGGGFAILPVDEGFIGGGGGGFGAAPGNEALLDGLTGGTTIVNVTVNAAVAEATLADKIVDALTDYNRRSGPLQLEIA